MHRLANHLLLLFFILFFNASCGINKQNPYTEREKQFAFNFLKTYQNGNINAFNKLIFPACRDFYVKKKIFNILESSFLTDSKDFLRDLHGKKVNIKNCFFKEVKINDSDLKTIKKIKAYLNVEEPISKIQLEYRSSSYSAIYSRYAIRSKNKLFIIFPDYSQNITQENNNMTIFQDEISTDNSKSSSKPFINTIRILIQNGNKQEAQDLLKSSLQLFPKDNELLELQRNFHSTPKNSTKKHNN